MENHQHNHIYTRDRYRCKVDNRRNSDLYKNKQQVVVVDEMFGTESVEWKEGFWLGLDIAGPTAGVLIAVGIVGLYKSRK